jgi:hypothetical protein
LDEALLRITGHGASTGSSSGNVRAIFQTTWCNPITKSYTPSYSGIIVKQPSSSPGHKIYRKQRTRTSSLSNGEMRLTVLCTPCRRLDIRAHEFQSLDLEAPGQPQKTLLDQKGDVHKLSPLTLGYLDDFY